MKDMSNAMLVVPAEEGRAVAEALVAAGRYTREQLVGEAGKAILRRICRKTTGPPAECWGRMFDVYQKYKDCLDIVTGVPLFTDDTHQAFDRLRKCISALRLTGGHQPCRLFAFAAASLPAAAPAASLPAAAPAAALVPATAAPAAAVAPAPAAPAPAAVVPATAAAYAPAPTDRLDTLGCSN